MILLANGFEEVEAMAVIDVLRRAEIKIVVAGLSAEYVESARGVRVIPDTTIETIKADDYDILILPGGIPGTDNLNADERVKTLVLDFSKKGKLTGAICAAPSILAGLGLLDGKTVTSYPTYREKLGNVDYREDKVVEDGNILTSRGPATALCFALAIVKRLAGRSKADELKQKMLIDYCD
ncbi:MAG: DJ-1 family glyoxalase III [Thermodesulfovibrionales bacterium]